MEASRERANAFGSFPSILHAASSPPMPLGVASFCKQILGGTASEVSWSVFIEELKELATLSDSDCAMLRVSLDAKCNNQVTANALMHFLGVFGGLPLEHSLSQMRTLLKESWFYAHLSHHDAVQLLKGKPVGTFLVCFAGDEATTQLSDTVAAFGVFFVWHTGTVLPIQVLGCFGRGVLVCETTGEWRSFESLYQLLDYYHEWLSTPLTSVSLRNQAWFYAVTTHDAVERLSRKPKRIGTYLIREEPQSVDQERWRFMCSYVASPSAEIVHEVIEFPWKQLALHPQEQQAQLVAYMTEFIRCNRVQLLYNYDVSGVPLLNVTSLKDTPLLHAMQGPVNVTKSDEAHYTSVVSVKSVSTYPRSASAECHIICDRYSVHVFNNWRLACVADGCGWGARACEAARKATTGMVEYVLGKKHKLRDLTSVAHSLKRGMSAAHEKIGEGMLDVRDTGTTTLLAALVVTLDDNEAEHRHAVVCASVGDCKAFRWSPQAKLAVDITAQNRGGLRVTDPGGRLGAYHDDGSPDLRNLRTCFEPCLSGDIVVLMSDGVHDNLDPHMLGRTPFESGSTQEEGVTWEELHASVIEEGKERFMCRLLARLLDGCSTPKQVVEALIAHCEETTKCVRDLMDQNPKARQPTDSTRYPGKMDHATCIAVCVPSC